MIGSSREDDLLSKLKSCIGGMTSKTPLSQNTKPISFSSSEASNLLRSQHPTLYPPERREPIPRNAYQKGPPQNNYQLPKGIDENDYGFRNVDKYSNMMKE